jgi:iron complex outermembrane receptor protein
MAASAKTVDSGNIIERLKEMSIEELMDIEVTSVSKKKESLQQAAAAVYVLTQEDIRRSGATSLPELLRMVPGV